MFNKDHNQQKEEPECQYDVKYIGGHPAFPKSHDTKVLIFKDRLELEEPYIVIPYDTITNIENMDEKKIKALRVIALGLIFLPLAIVGALWKKKSLYTVIQTHDINNMEIALILDFHKKIEIAQSLIYNKIVAVKQNTTLITTPALEQEHVGGPTIGVKLNG
jgi:hypothetical protein